MSKIRITKQFSFETGHALYGYDGKCKNVHGHSYRLDVTVIGKPIEDNSNVKLGMVIDFGDLKKIVKSEIVDVFAPGYDIYSTVPNNEYDIYDGTSMAGPMVAGLAALIMSYYPEISMIDVREIIVTTVLDPGRTTPLPSDHKKEVTFDELCVSGGIVNVYNAIALAEKW